MTKDTQDDTRNDRLGNTLKPIELDVQELAGLSFDAFVKALLEKLKALKDSRFDFYNQQRRKRSQWANGARYVLAVLGTLAILATAVAAAVRIAYGMDPPEPAYDVWAFFVALVLYALMGAISFYERTTDQTATYFRHLGITLAIRDLWTRLQLEFLKELLPQPDDTAQAATRERLRTLAEAFCRDLDKLADSELSEWRTELINSLSELEAAAKSGTETVNRQMTEAIEAMKKQAAEAAKAAKAAEEAAKPAIVNLTIEGDFDDKVAVLVDDKEVATTRLHLFPVDRLTPGFHKFEARAKKTGKEIGAALATELKPGLQALTMKLT